jgi:hypothetical protein
MDWEVLIPILMFAFPVIVALLDKRAKQKRAASQPTPRPRPTFPSVSRDAAVRELAPENVRQGRTPPTDTVSGPLPLTEPRVATVFRGDSRDSRTQNENNSNTEEGVRAIKKREEKSPQRQQPADKLKIDKKKLILYSEILKPKYDD